jgi:hypothetical protein
MVGPCRSDRERNPREDLSLVHRAAAKGILHSASNPGQGGAVEIHRDGGQQV